MDGLHNPSSAKATYSTTQPPTPATTATPRPAGPTNSLLAGFVLFRLFDIVKPWPIKGPDRHVHGGFGIVVDDVVAGIFAAVLMHIGF